MTLDDLRGEVGREVGVSAWRRVDQTMVDRFAEVTDDRQFIHVDPARAAETPFGGAIAHGFLTLSLLSAFAREALPALEGRRMGVNYGFERVRFVWPVRVGSRLRARFQLLAVEERGPERALLRHGVIVEIEGGLKLALHAEWLTLAVFEAGALTSPVGRGRPEGPGEGTVPSPDGIRSPHPTPPASTSPDRRGGASRRGRGTRKENTP